MSPQSAASYFTPTGPVIREVKCTNYILKETRRRKRNERKKDRQKETERKEGKKREREKTEKVREIERD